MTGLMQHSFEAMRDCDPSQCSEAEHGVSDSGASVPCPSQTDEVREQSLPVCPDDGLREGLDSAHDFQMGSPMLTEEDLVDREDRGALLDRVDGMFYEAPRLLDSPFMSYDLVSSLQAYSPLGVRHIMPAGNCITPPSYLQQSPFQGKSPQSKLRSAARSFSGSPSILRKRPRQLLIPSKAGTSGEKLDAKFKEVVSHSGPLSVLVGVNVKGVGGVTDGTGGEKSSKSGGLQSSCQARTALFASPPPSKFGAELDVDVSRSDSRPSRVFESVECTTDSDVGVGFSGRDGSQGGACGFAPRDSVVGKFNKRGRCQGSSCEYSIGSRPESGMPASKQDGSVLTEQHLNGQTGPGPARFSVEGSSSDGVLESHGVSVLPGKQVYGEVRRSCDGSVLGSGDAIGVPVLSKAFERRELMSPGNAATFSAWGSVTCAMAACFSPGVTVLQQTPGKDWLQDFDTANIFASPRFTSPRFASPTAIWRSPWRLDPFPSAQKEGSLSFMDGLEAPLEDGVDDALGLMRRSNEQNPASMSESEEVVSKNPPGLPMPSPLSGYRLRPGSSRRGDDAKENRRMSSEMESGGSAMVNWLLPSPDHGIARTPVRGASTLGLNSVAEDGHVFGGGGCDQFSPSMYLLKECR